MDSETEQRIIALETKIAYMEDFVNQLQAVSVEHTKTIELLRKENKLLSSKLKDLSDQVEGDIPNRRPPHY
ncbi:MAG: SlyX family protein [Treponema sp.]|nr:SlyX family protein [Treponema sp.]